LALGEAFTKQQREEIRLGYYELHLVLAEAVALEKGSAANLRQAIQILKRAAPLGPLTRAYCLRHARYLDQLGQPDMARAEKNRAPREPASALDDFLLGYDLQRQGQVEPAIQRFESALGRDPGHFWARYFLAVCYLRLQRPADSLAAKVCLTGCFASLTDGLQEQPDFVWIYVLRGFAHGQLHEDRAAEADFREALKRKPKPDARYAILVNRGLFRSRQRGWADKAKADLQRAVRLKPDQYQAYANLAGLYQRQQQLGAAVEQLDRAIAVAEPQVDNRRLEPAALALLYHNRAWLRWQRSDLEAALRDFDRSLRLKPAPETHAARGRLLYQLGKYTEAVKAHDMALSGHPVRVNAHRWRAEALLRLEKYEMALQSFDRYLKAPDPEAGSGELADVYRARGLTRAKLRNYPGALDDYHRSLTLKPDAATHTLRGWAYLVSQATRLAERDFEEAIRLNPDYADAYNGRANVQLLLGRYQQAVVAAEEAARRGQHEPRICWNAARVIALVIGRLDGEARTGGQDWAKRACHQEMAVKFLRQAIRLTPKKEQQKFWEKYIQSNAALVGSLRDCPEFDQLAAIYSRRDR
jgi:tetratricopeptide (TPR) repeat protein